MPSEFGASLISSDLMCWVSSVFQESKMEVSPIGAEEPHVVTIDFKHDLIVNVAVKLLHPVTGISSAVMTRWSLAREKSIMVNIE